VVVSENKKVKTLRLRVDPLHLETPEAREALNRGAGILRAGGLVAMPTETVYGLGANAQDAAAVGRIFVAKARPAWDPVIVHIAGGAAGEAMLAQLVATIPDAARKLMDAFWPGPLTLLLPRTAAVPDAVTAGRALVGVRMPAHPVALALIRVAGVPVAAPSANRFSHVSPTTADHVLADLEGRIDAVLDAGPALHGVESTVVDACQSPMMIYRPGAVTIDQIRDVAGSVEIFMPAQTLVETPQAAMPSPGVGVRHYAPRARLVLVDAAVGELAARLSEAAIHFQDERVGALVPRDVEWRLRSVVMQPWGRWAAPEELASELYAGLRALDAQGCTVILCPLPAAGGIGDALRDRLRKAEFRAAGREDALA
jgi:L-threonylcarbamoyladenylate synthase